MRRLMYDLETNYDTVLPDQDKEALTQAREHLLDAADKMHKVASALLEGR